MIGGLGNACKNLWLMCRLDAISIYPKIRSADFSLPFATVQTPKCTAKSPRKPAKKLESWRLGVLGGKEKSECTVEKSALLLRTEVRTLWVFG
jgi:hypothetical protein